MTQASLPFGAATAHRALALVSSHTGIAPEVIVSRNRKPALVDARRIAAMLLLFYSDMPEGEVMPALGRDRTTLYGHVHPHWALVETDKTYREIWDKSKAEWLAENPRRTCRSYGQTATKQ